PINDGQWHHVVFTRDAVSGVVKTYVDGILNSTATGATGNKTSHFSSIGSDVVVANDGVTRQGAIYFNGQLDDVRIYNQVLGDNEIKSLALIPGAPVLNSATAASGTIVHLDWTTPSTYTQNIEIWRKPGAA